MTDQEKNTIIEDFKKTSESGTVDNAQDYIAAIKELKENTVSKEDYEKLKSDNAALAKAVLNGEPASEQSKIEEPKTLSQLREFMHKDGISNLEYCKSALDLRDAIIASGGKDPFVPYGINISPTYEDTQAAERVSDVLKQCIDYAEGDSALFTQELQRRTNDVRIRK